MTKRNKIIIIMCASHLSSEGWIYCDFLSVMGVTGAGKSRFVDLAGKTAVKGSTHDLEPRRQVIRKVPCEHPEIEGSVVLVDVPGFDYSPTMSSVSIVLDVAKSLKSAYGNRVKVVKIVYLCRISDNRHNSGSPLDIISTFARLSGYKIGAVVLATTMWGNVAERVGTEREKLLRDQYWELDLKVGSKLMRFHNSYDSAWEIIKSLTSESSTYIQEMPVPVNESDQKGRIMNGGDDREATRRLRELKRKITRIFGDQGNGSCVVM